MNQKLSFIVPMFEHLDQSKVMLASLLATVPAGLDFEVIMVDDGSTDGTRDWLGRLRDERIRPLLNPTNLGYARSNNRAVQVAAGDVLGLLNNDLILLPGWLEPMLEVLREPAANAGIVGNVQLRVDDDRIDHAGIEVTHLAKVEHIRARPPGGEARRRVFAVTGACCLISRRDFQRVGGFDERYLNGGEDVDLCLKLRAQGRYAQVAAASRVRHHVSLTRSANPQSQERAERNSRLLFQQWGPVIQWETKGAWLRLLASPADPAAARVIDEFCLAPAYERAPQAVSGILAKSICHREEARWRQLLDGDVPIDPQPLESVQGLRWGHAGRLDDIQLAERYAWCDGRVRLVLPRGSLSRSLAISGRIFGRRDAEPAWARGIVIGIQINGVQTRTWRAQAPGDFRIALDRPAALSERDNLVSVSVTWIPDAARRDTTQGLEPLQAVRFFALILDGDRVLDLGHRR